MAFQCIRCKAEIERSYRACPFCGEQITDFMRTHADQPLDGKYRIVDRLGAGGMGEVYKAEHTFLGNTRVIKVIRPQISGSADAHERFLREARAATRIQHPNVATLHDFSSLPDGSHYMVWEFIDGENLAQRMKLRGTLPPRYAAQLIVQALAGLDAIHRAGIVHRDISPENLMVQRDPDGTERVKIIDLGVAKVDGSDDGGTRAGVFVGKLRYASPEQLGFLGEGEKIDGRADIFSIAMVLYELLAGRPPFEATSPHEYVLLHSRERQIRPLDLDGVAGGEALQSVLERALDRDREKRFANAREFGLALEEVIKTLPDPSLMRTVAGAAWDGDATMRVTPPAGSTTLAPDAAAAPTVRTPLPTYTAPSGASPPTVIDHSAAPAARRAAGPLIAVVTLLLLAAAVAAFFMTRSGSQSDPVAAVATTTPSAPPSTTVSVDATATAAVDTATTATTSPALVVAPAATATGAAAPAAAQPRESRPAAVPLPVAPVERPEEPPPAAPASNAATYIDGAGGDEATNDELLSSLRRELHGVTRVSVVGSGEGQQRLAAILRDELSGVTIGAGGTVVIDFESTLRPLGRGRKERSATATITKNGRAIFRYRLGPEVYRMGDTPVEAFSRVLLDAFDR